MRKIHEIVWIAGVEYRKWFSLKKMLILLFSILFLGEYVFSDMACVAEETGLLVNLLEPMDLVLSFQFYMLVIPLIFIVLLSGFPDKSGGNIFVMMRVKRRIWLADSLCLDSWWELPVWEPSLRQVFCGLERMLSGKISGANL